MPTTKSQSPGPNPATSQPKQARSRKAATPTEQSTAGRAGSAGGIILDAKKKASPTAATPKPSATTPAADSAAGPNRQRRRPRKLNKEPTSESAPAATATTAATAKTAAATSPAEAELEALKSRVRGLEAKVEELYNSTEARTGRSPRRRGKGRKGSSATQVPTISSTVAHVEDEEEADEELVRLEDELETARRDLEIYQPRTRPRPRTKRSTSGGSDYIEEVPRDGRDTVAVGDRQVTLSGSYRIPLPANLDMKDVQKIQSGVSAAQNVAKSFLEQRRATQAARAPTPPAATSASTARPKAAARKTSSPSMEVTTEKTGKSWGDWIGGYSMAISRAVKNIEAEAAIESQRAGRTSAARPAPVKRSVSAASTVRKTTAPAAGAARRPTMKGRQGNLSSEQVHGLMS